MVEQSSKKNIEKRQAKAKTRQVREELKKNGWKEKSPKMSPPRNDPWSNHF